MPRASFPAHRATHPPSSPAPADVIPWLLGAPVRLPRRVHAVAAYRRPTAEARARQTSILGFRQAADNAVPVSFPRSVPPHVTAIQSIQVRPVGPACRASTVSEFDTLAHRPPSAVRQPAARRCPPVPPSLLLSSCDPSAISRCTPGRLSIQPASQLSPSLSCCIQDMLPARQLEAICWPPSCASSPAPRRAPGTYPSVPRLPS